MCSADKKSGCPVEARLKDLVDRGYRFIHPSDDDGHVVAVVGIRAHGSVIDVIRLNAEDDAVASRVPGDEPDILSPRKMLWRRRGTAHEVLADLLALADDYGADRARPVGGCWVPGRSGHAKWLAAAG
ncbi:hypothetical protein LWP59_39565 [Amycolatopsis acidiphila]|uniref:Uncharacterized protein n=1 Tax=Amycolatopsis acidiphila TaxID=715473 RepID=A0A558A2J3_9PSEU|nr:hypothetical protein [Amycolatopsis acidiphila]TVT18478.1 hypothetical protein FNH06_27650 [Amycolatopsis acidiphila]UIJ60009.1 hypothetical protein LWP59_39565 [Amycolatopsis acidiphila]GHG61896.1 hypothetical protein GCM10017788_17050 [Amycolatopsis acidiphila]